MAPARHSRLFPVLLALMLVLPLGLSLLVAGPAAADDDPATVPQPLAGEPWFGPGLDWSRDLPADYARRLGETPSLYVQRVDYPLTEQSDDYLEQFAQQAATQGAGAVLSLEPTAPLDDLTEADAEALAARLVELHQRYDTFFLVRFGAEMNGSWVTWGQQPSAYVRAFRVVADAVHAATDQAVLVWSPVYGAGYPYGAAYGDVAPSEDRSATELDTNGDGIVSEADDPYGPYWPGSQWVDWVGITLYHFGEDQDRVDNDLDAAGGGTAGDPEDGTGFATNVVPGPDAVEARWQERYGYGGTGTREPFYDRFAAANDLPLLLETGALWQPGVEGDDELSIKQAWWRQVLASLESHPLVEGISWLEQRRPEAEAGDKVVDWRATRSPDLADGLATDLDDSPVRLGPLSRVLDQDAANEATAQGRLPDGFYGPSGGDEMGWIVFCAALLAGAFLLAGLVGRWVPSWRYPDERDPRDRRIDLFRGFIIVAVVLTHIEVAGPYSFVSLKAVGAITGAEMFVLLSGIVLGMVYAPTVAKLGEWGAAVVMLRRARKQYVVAVVVVLLVYLLGRLPFLDATDVTTFTDRGTGLGGSAVSGQVYDLYTDGAQLLLYPPPWYAVRQLLLLEMGPWVFNIMGLFVVLSLLLPLLMVLVKRRLWWLLLVLSWVGYVIGTRTGASLLPSQFEAVFPLLIWQLPFCHGLVVGHYRRQVVTALTSRVGKVVTATFVVGYAGVLGYLWVCHHVDVAPTPFRVDSYGWLYAHAYTRVDLQGGRLLDLVLMVVAAYAFLTTCWKPVNAAIGWFWIPLGAASLYVFIVHVFFAVAVGNVPGLDRSVWWQGTIVHTVVLALIWLMVRRKVLFSVIPR